MKRILYLCALACLAGVVVYAVRLASMPNLVHARFELFNVFFQINMRWRVLESPRVNAAGNILKAVENVDGELSQCWLELLRICIVMAVFY